MQDCFSEPCSPARNIGIPQDPFLSLPTTPECNESRVWALHNPIEPDFAIWEDPACYQSPSHLTRSTYFDAGEEKENRHATVSDYDTSDEDEYQRGRIDWTQVQVGPHDAFGLPVHSPFVNALANISIGRHADNTYRATYRRNPTLIAAETNVGPQRDEDEWDDSLSVFQEEGNVFMGPEEDRTIYGRQLPVRDANVEGQTRAFLET